MVVLSYKDFIFKITKKELFVLKFSVPGYSHYNFCTIETVFDTIPNNSDRLYRITCTLTKDKTEKVSFLNDFKEEYKLFNLGRKGTYTLKTIWDHIEILEIENY